MTKVILADELEEIRLGASTGQPSFEKHLILRLLDYVEYLQDKNAGRSRELSKLPPWPVGGERP